MGVVSLFAFPVIGVMLDKKGRMPIVIFSIICAGIGMLLVAVAPSPFHPLCYVAAIVAGIGMAGSIVGANTLAMDASPITLMGAVMGGLSTMQPIGILVFLGVGGVLFDSVAPGAAFALKGIASLPAGYLAFHDKQSRNPGNKGNVHHGMGRSRKDSHDEDPRRCSPGRHRRHRGLCPGPGRNSYHG